MRNWAIVRKSDLEILNIYKSDRPLIFGGAWGNDEHEHVSFSENQDISIVKASLFEGRIIIEVDSDKASQKLSESRNAKLKRLREIRKEKLAEVDAMMNDLHLGERDDKERIKSYRKDLLEITDDYKMVSNPNKAKVAIDEIDPDDVDIWPTKPI